MLPVYGNRTLLSTLTHQPDPATQFESWSRYVTTRTFLLSHIFGSIAGAAFGIIGMAALAAFLAGTRRSGLAAAGLVTGIFGQVLLTSVFGVAAGAQPALGRAFLAGESAAQDLYDQVYGAPVLALAGTGVVLFSTAFILLGWAAAASGRIARWAGVCVAVGGPLVGIAGFVFGPSQTVGSLLVLAGGIAAAASVSRERRSEAAA